MSQSHTPIAFFHQQSAILRSHLPGIFDGRVDSIHDARIATRRMREALPLTHEWQRRRDADDFSARIKEIGRALVRSRDADVRIELLRYFEARLPHAAAALVAVRQRQERDRLRLARTLIKRMEQLGVAEELARLSKVAARQSRGFLVAMTGAWRLHLRRRLAERAQEAGAALVHATGVYFPNRSHAARIAIKKFRYAAEISAHAGLLVDEPLLRTLKKAEWQGGVPHLPAARLFCGFYLNELMLKLLARDDAHENLFDCYENALTSLAGGEAEAGVLRGFEKAMLRETGYALALTVDAFSGDAVSGVARYTYIPGRGPRRLVNGDSPGLEISGQTLLDIDRNDFSLPRTATEAKLLMRMLVQHQMNGRPLVTRQVFSQLLEL